MEALTNAINREFCGELAFYIIVGRDRYTHVVREHTVADDETVHDRIRAVRALVNDEEVLSDPLIKTASRITVLRIWQNGADPMKVAPSDVVDLLSEETWIKLAAAAMQSLRDEPVGDALRRELGRFWSQIEELRRDAAHTRQRMEDAFGFVLHAIVRGAASHIGNAARTGMRAERASAKQAGTGTRLVPCPQCKIEKRCDANTKQFKCGCGFDAPYPLERPAT